MPTKLLPTPLSSPKRGGPCLWKLSCLWKHESFAWEGGCLAPMACTAPGGISAPCQPPCCPRGFQTDARPSWRGAQSRRNSGRQVALSLGSRRLRTLRKREVSQTTPLCPGTRWLCPVPRPSGGWSPLNIEGLVWTVPPQSSHQTTACKGAHLLPSPGLAPHRPHRRQSHEVACPTPPC